MKWIYTSHPSSAVHVFNLVEANTIKEVLRYHPLQQSARIACTGRQRVFFIEEGGFRSNHFIFKNEYGFEIGRLFVENGYSDGGSIEIEEKRLHYRLLSNLLPELVIYEHDSVQPLVTCGFTNTGHDTSFSFSNKETMHEYASLLLGLCWYLFNPSFSENKMGTPPVLSFA